jgi:hypothetical protein
MEAIVALKAPGARWMATISWPRPPDGNSLKRVQSCWLKKLHFRRIINACLLENKQRARRIGGLSKSLTADFVGESEKTSRFVIINE